MKVIPKRWDQLPDENGNGLLEAAFSGCVFGAPVLMETHNVSADDVKMVEEQEFGFFFEAADEAKTYADESDYHNRKECSMAAESFIPSGMFSPSGDENFQQTATAIISGRVTKTYGDPTAFGFDPTDTLLSMEVDGGECDVILHEKINIAVGNIVSGVFWVQGWPKGV